VSDARRRDDDEPPVSWLDGSGPWASVPTALLYDPNVSEGAVRVWAALASYADSDGACFPGQERLAERLGRSPDSVHRAIAALRKAGWLEVTRRGLGMTNLYRLRRSPRDGLGAERGIDSGLSAEQDSGPSAEEELEPVELHPEELQPTRARTRSTGVATSTLAGRNLRRVDGFGEFWVAYPLKVGKRQALRAWQAALKRADQQTILTGLTRVSPHFKPGYVPHPTTWLNRDGWLDEVVAHDAGTKLGANLARLSRLRQPDDDTKALPC